ncbi:acyltransferase family protein [Absiella sp. AM29-15]|uniref:acyltransferase family protein n=1 Tax=Absiella sp. AM29-15 TaxID=2292278 RepID=UPI000E423F3C|nr:acyltransferase [Absiella sp. AM29-15]RGC52535.1 acyltransferase [Absiella sp. AM29-15]
MDNAKRIEWLDSLKGLAIIFVVLGHALLGFVEIDFFDENIIILKTIQIWIYKWHMPLFLSLSGTAFYLSNFNRRQDSINYRKILKQVLNLFIIYFIFQISLCTLKYVFNIFVSNQMTISNLIINIFYPDTLMWYLWVLIVYYILFMFVLMMNIDDKYIFLFTIGLSIIIGIFYSNINARICLKNLLNYMSFFYFGIYFIKSNKFKKNINIIVAITIFIILSISYIFSIDFKSFNNVLDILYAYSIIIILYKCFSNYQILNKKNILSKLGKGSLVIYLFHTYFVTIIKNIVIFMEIKNVIPVVCIATILPLILTYCIYQLSGKLKVLNVLLHPIKYIDTYYYKIRSSDINE